MHTGTDKEIDYMAYKGKTEMRKNAKKTVKTTPKRS